MQNLEKLFKEICLEEAKHLNEFWEKSNKRLNELEVNYEDEKLKEKERELKYIELCKEIDNILNYDGFIGNYTDVIDYFSRTHLNYTVKNLYFDIHPKLRKLYNLLPKRFENLHLLQKEYNKLKIKMHYFKHINEEILINSILKAFQYIIPEREYDLDFGKAFYFPSSRQFPWTYDAQEQFVDYELVTWYKNNINDYLCTPICDLKIYERARLFK